MNEELRSSKYLALETSRADIQGVWRPVGIWDTCFEGLRSRLTQPGSQCSEGYSLRRDCMMYEEGSFANLNLTIKHRYTKNGKEI